MAINPLQSAAVGWPNVKGAAKGAAQSFAQVFDRARNASDQAAGKGAAASGSDVVVESPSAAGAKADGKRAGTVRPAQLRQEAERLLGSLQTHLKKVLADAGVTTPPPVQLAVDPSGDVRLLGDHPDREKIEAVLAEQPALIEQLQAAAGAYRTLREAELGPAAADPLFGPTFSATFNGEAVQTSFV